MAGLTEQVVADLFKRAEDMGITMGQLAYISKIGSSTLSEIKNGKRDINLAKIEKICEALKVRPVLSFTPVG